MLPPHTRMAIVVKTALFNKYLKVMECQRVTYITLDPNPAYQFHDYATNAYLDACLYHFLFPENLWPFMFQKKPLYLFMLKNVLQGIQINVV